MDGTHIPVNVRTRVTGTPQTAYISQKPNSKGKKCLSFLVATLQNNFCAAIGWPAPATYDAKIVHTIAFPDGTKNFQLLNKCFTKFDTCAADCGFSTFTPTGQKSDLLKSAVITRIIKPKNGNLSAVGVQINSQIGQARNGIEMELWKCKREI